MATGISRTKWQGETKHSLAEELPPVDPQAEVFLSYPGKASVECILSVKPAETLEIWRGTPLSDVCFNRLYYGENLGILASLMNDQAVRGHVKLIYIDPPFATNSVFQSRCQNDAYHDLLAGAPYVEFLRRRLILLRELLAEDGSIYVHLDQKMAFQIKVIMDEIFGCQNFRNWITRKKCNPKNYTRKAYGNVSDYILFYTKSNAYGWNRAYDAWTLERAAKEYEYKELRTGRKYKKVPVHAPGVRNGKTGDPWRGMMPPPGKHWQYTPEKLDEFDANGEIYWSPNGNPRRKVYLDESEGVPVQDIWIEFRDAHNQMIEITGYPTEKNPAILARIIRASSNEGDLVLDCFAGSGTTLSVSSQLGRRWIGIDSSPEAMRHIFRRFTTGTERMGDFVTPRAEITDESFRELELPLFGPEPEGLAGHKQKSRWMLIQNFSFSTEKNRVSEIRPLLNDWINEHIENKEGDLAQPGASRDAPEAAPPEL